MSVMWDERLISRGRAADMCGKWGLKMDAPYLRCETCDGNVTMLPGNGAILNVDTIIGKVLGHMVKCHGYSLSGGGNGDQ